MIVMCYFFEEEVEVNRTYILGCFIYLTKPKGEMLKKNTNLVIQPKSQSKLMKGSVSKIDCFRGSIKFIKEERVEVFTPPKAQAGKKCIVEGVFREFF